MTEFGLATVAATVVMASLIWSIMAAVIYLSKIAANTKSAADALNRIAYAIERTAFPELFRRSQDDPPRP